MHLTDRGDELLAGLSAQHAVELGHLRTVVAALSVLERDDSGSAAP